MTPRVRRCVQLAGLVLLGLVVVVGWASAAEARPEEDEPERRVSCPQDYGVPEDTPCYEYTFECDDRNILEQTWDTVTPGGGADPVKLVVPGPVNDNPDDDGRNEWDWYVDETRIQADRDNCELANHRPRNPCVRGQGAPDEGLEFPLPENCWGPYPTSHYTISYDGGDWNEFDRKLFGVVTKFVFSVGRAAVQLGLWLVGNAFSFDIKDYTSFSDALAQNYQDRLIEQPLTDSSSWNLEDLVWFVLISFAGITALRGKMAVAGGEIGLSIVVAALALVLMQNREGFMNTTADLIDDTSAALLMAGTGNDPSSASSESTIQEAVGRLQAGIHDEFVATPYDWINWGPPGNLNSDACQAARNRVLQVGISDDGGWARAYMSARGCRAASAHNREPNETRLMGAALTSAVGVWVSLVLGLTALTVIISKFTVALLFALVPFAAVAAALPGTGRRMAWMWLATLVQAVFAVAGTSVVLTFLMLGVRETRNIAGSDQNPRERWLVVLLIVAVVYMARRRLLNASQQAATAVTDNLTRMSPASNWQGGIPAGMNLDGMDRAVSSKIGGASKLAAYGGAAAAGGLVAAGARTITTRRAEKRQARRALNNLEIMERRREHPHYEFKATPRPAATGGRSMAAAAGRLGRAHGRSGGAAHRNSGTDGRGPSHSHAGSHADRGSGTPIFDQLKHEFDTGGVRTGGVADEGAAIADFLGESGGKYGGGSPGYDISAHISGKFRAPRSYRPKPNDFLHPSRLVKRPFQATGDRLRYGRFKRQFRKMTASHHRATWNGRRGRFNRANRQDRWRTFKLR